MERIVPGKYHVGIWGIMVILLNSKYKYKPAEEAACDLPSKLGLHHSTDGCDNCCGLLECHM